VSIRFFCCTEFIDLDKMDIELLLAMENAEHYNEQQRLSKNSLLRKQRNVNLTEGLLPYVEETKSAANCISSNSKISASTATIHTHHTNYDIDFDLILIGNCVESTEINDSSNDDEDESDENLILSNVQLFILFYFIIRSMTFFDGGDLGR